MRKLASDRFFGHPRNPSSKKQSADKENSMRKILMALLVLAGVGQAQAQYSMTPGQSSQQFGPFSAVGHFSASYEITQTATGMSSLSVLGWYSCQSTGGRGGGTDCFYIQWTSIQLLDSNGAVVGMFSPQPYGTSTTQTEWVNNVSSLPAGVYTLRLVGNSEYSHNEVQYESWKGYYWIFLQ
jgi:hypothetical protein